MDDTSKTVKGGDLRINVNESLKRDKGYNCIVDFCK